MYEGKKRRETLENPLCVTFTTGHNEAYWWTVKANRTITTETGGFLFASR